MCNCTSNYMPAGVIYFLYYYSLNACFLWSCWTRKCVSIVRLGRSANLFLLLLGRGGKTSLSFLATKFILVFNSLGLRYKKHFQHLLFFFSVTGLFSCLRTKTSRKVYAFEMLQSLIICITLVPVTRSTSPHTCIRTESKKAFTHLGE